MNADKCFDYWIKKINIFCNKYGSKDFNVKVLNLQKSYVPVFKYQRNYIISIKYKKDEFIDIAITNYKIPKSMVDIPTSTKVQLPLKTEEYYLIEFLGLVYMENTPHVNPYVYYKRNPITGIYHEKGKKDIMKSKFLCNYTKKQRYAKYCELIKNITIEKYKKMSKKDRDSYFILLNNIFKI
jgi:hypothetical protein